MITCPFCKTHLMDMHDDKLVGWKKCTTCNWSQDKEGRNALYPYGYKPASNPEPDNFLKKFFSRFASSK